jgi:hypothetical protein
MISAILSILLSVSPAFAGEQIAFERLVHDIIQADSKRDVESSIEFYLEAIDREGLTPKSRKDCEKTSLASAKLLFLCRPMVRFSGGHGGVD